MQIGDYRALVVAVKGALTTTMPHPRSASAVFA
ncbi:MAG: hypothetical protein ACI8W7_004079, partial [Gammaproteobacteria bacterium]